VATSYLEPVSPSLRELLALLRDRLPPVPLPEAGGRVLADLADDVVAAAAVAREKDEAAEAAYRALAEVQRDLVRKAARARAYARICAGDDKGLVAALDAVALPVDDEAPTLPPTASLKKKKPRSPSP
jgi:hypothetical protein